MALLVLVGRTLRGTAPGTTEVLGPGDDIIGRRVTVVGRVGEVVSAKSFTLTDGNDVVLVLDASTIPAIDNDRDRAFTDERVRVRGVGRTFVIEEIERSVGPLDEKRHERFVGRPALVADAVTPL